MTVTLSDQSSDTTTRLHGNGREPNGALGLVAAALQDELQRRIAGEVRFDAVSRMLYSTDASNYQIDPVGVVIPATREDVLATIEIAAQHRVPLLPRGGGSSLSGQTVGAALVVDFSKVLSRVLEIDVEGGFVTVEPGINIDALNRQLKPRGVMFGPDPASANRATAGGVVGNNSTGSHSILYGMTGDNVQAVTAATVEGAVLDLGPLAPAAMAGRSSIDDAKGRPLQSASGVSGALRWVDRPRFPAALASRHRLLARPVAQTRRRVQSGPIAGLVRRDAGHPARDHLPARTETDEDRSRAAAI